MNSKVLEPATVLEPSALAEFLRVNKIIPIHLVTITRPREMNEQASAKLMLRDPRRTTRAARTAVQSRDREVEPMSNRVARDGQEIVDYGTPFMEGAMLASSLKSIIGEFEVANFVQLDNNPPKIEIYRKGDNEGQTGAVEVEKVAKAIRSIPDNTLVNFIVWLNPDRNGWFRYNLVLNKWDATAEKPVKLSLIVQQGIPTIDPIEHGISF